GTQRRGVVALCVGLGTARPLHGLAVSARSPCLREAPQSVLSRGLTQTPRRRSAGSPRLRPPGLTLLGRADGSSHELPRLKTAVSLRSIEPTPTGATRSAHRAASLQASLFD